MFSSKLTRGSLLTDPRVISILLIQIVGLLGTNAPPPVLGLMATDIGVSDTEIGLVMTVFALPGILMVPIAGVLADIFGRRRIVLFSLLVLGTAGVAIGFTENFHFILLLRAIQGIGYAGTTPLTVTLIGDLTSGPEGSKAQGYLVSASGAASVFIPAISGFVLRFGWESSFYLFGVIFIVIMIVYVTLPETLSPDNQASGAELISTIRTYIRSITAELKDIDFALLYVGAFVEYFVKYGMFTFLPLFAIRIFGTSGFIAGVLISVYGFVRMVVSLFTKQFTSIFGLKYAIVASTGISALGIGFIAVAPGIPSIVAAVVVYSIGDAFLAALLNDMTTKKSQAEHRGGIVSGLNMMKNIGKAAAPALLGGLLAITSFSGLFFLSAGLLGVYLILAVGLLSPVEM